MIYLYTNTRQRIQLVFFILLTKGRYLDYLQTMDSRAEFDLRRFGTVPRLDMQTLEENQQGQYGAEENHDNQRNLLNLSDSGSDIQPPESADPNRMYPILRSTSAKITFSA